MLLSSLNHQFFQTFKHSLVVGHLFAVPNNETTCAPPSCHRGVTCWVPPLGLRVLSPPAALLQVLQRAAMRGCRVLSRAL
jgi:hypothetical protein